MPITDKPLWLRAMAGLAFGAVAGAVLGLGGFGLYVWLAPPLLRNDSAAMGRANVLMAFAFFALVGGLALGACLGLALMLGLGGKQKLGGSIAALTAAATLAVAGLQTPAMALFAVAVGLLIWSFSATAARGA